MSTEEVARREYLVWLETGDRMDCASVYKRRAWWTVELQPFFTGDRVRSKGFRNEQEAYGFAREYAETYMGQAIEYERANFHSADEWKNEFADAYSIQEVEN